MAETKDQKGSCGDKFVSHTGQSWIINEREGVPNRVVVEGDISNLLDGEPIILKDRIDIESLWPSGLKTFLFASQDTEIALSFIGANANSFIPMHWNRYTSEFVLELIKIEGVWWKMTNYNGYARDRSRELLDSCIKPSLKVESCFLEWAERFDIDQLGLQVNMDRGEYKFVVTSDKKDAFLEALYGDSQKD